MNKIDRLNSLMAKLNKDSGEREAVKMEYYKQLADLENEIKDLAEAYDNRAITAFELAACIYKLIKDEDESDG